MSLSLADAIDRAARGRPVVRVGGHPRERQPRAHPPATPRGPPCPSPAFASHRAARDDRQMGASDADRQRTIRRLNAGYAAGHLGSDTYAHRIDLAYRAGSAADLRSLTIDLSGRVRSALTAMLDGAAARLTPGRPDPPSVWLDQRFPGQRSAGLLHTAAPRRRARPRAGPAALRTACLVGLGR